MKKNVYEIITQRIVSKLEDALNNGGGAPWQKPWKTKRNFISKRPYSGINLLLLPDDETDFITWGQVSKLREEDPTIKVQKGFQKHYVVKWIFPEDDKGKSKGYGYPIYYNVIGLKDITGIESKEEQHFSEEYSQAEELLESMSPKPDICYAGDRACYSPSLDVINLPPKKRFYSTSEYYSTLFHEMIHWTGHESRCNRKLDNSFGDHAYSVEELVAEIGSAMMLSECGIHEERLAENQIAYLRSWLKALQSDTKFIWEASSKATKAVQCILGEKMTLKQQYPIRVQTQDHLLANKTHDIN